MLLVAIQESAKTVLKLFALLEENLVQVFTAFDFPMEHRKSIRITISLERFNREIRRFHRVVDIFPNEAACLRLVTFLLMETSEE